MGKQQVNTGKGNQTVNTNTVWDRIVALETNGVPKADMDDVKTQLAENVKLYRAKDNDAQNIQTEIDNLSAVGGGILKLISPQYTINQKITVKSKVEVIISPNTILNVSVNTDVFDIAKDGKLSGGRIVTPSGFDKTVITLDGVNKFYTQGTSVRDVILDGTGSGTGIKLQALNLDDYVYFTTFDSIFINKFEKALHLYSKSGNANGVNSNYFSNIRVNDSIYGCYIDGDRSSNTNLADGNIIDITVQTTSRTIYAVYCNGWKNDISLRDWDIKGTTISVLFDKTSSGNRLRAFYKSLYVNRLQVIDKGLTNEVNDIPNEYGFYLAPNTGNVTKNTLSDLMRGRVIKNFLGNQDDILSYANKKYVVTTSKSSTSGAVSSMFDFPSYCEFTMVDANEELVITIDLSSVNPTMLTVLGIQFGDYRHARYVKVETTTTGNTVDKHLENIDNVTGNVIIPLEAIGTATIKTITITLKNPADASTNKFRITRIYAGSAGVDGEHYMKKLSPSVYGDVTMLESGKGIIFKSPDGLTKKKLTIDNTGAAVWTTV